MIVKNLMLSLDIMYSDPDSIQIRTKPSGNDSDSDSEMSEGHASLDLASSHSSDEDDDMDLNWEKQLPKNKKIGELISFKAQSIKVEVVH